MGRRLTALAELLRADTENERRSAARLIERETGKHFNALLKRGIAKTLKGQDANIALNLVRTYAGDAMVQAVDLILQRNSVSWARLIQAGNKLTLKEKLGILRGKKVDVGRKRGSLHGVERDTLPQAVTGIPILWETSKNMEGEEVTIFYMKEAKAGGRKFRPLLPFQAEGSKASRKIEKAATEKKPLFMKIEEPGARDMPILAVPS